MPLLYTARQKFVSAANTQADGLVPALLFVMEKHNLSFSHVGLQKGHIQLYGVFTLNNNPHAAIYLMPGDMTSIAGQIDRDLTSFTYSPEEKLRLEHLSREMKRGIVSAESYVTWVAKETPAGRAAASAAQKIRQLPAGARINPVLGGHALGSEHGADMRLTYGG